MPGNTFMYNLPYPFLLPASPQRQLMHGGHQRQDKQQVQGQQGNADMVGDKAEEGRHQAVTQIGAGHKHPDDGLGVFCSEAFRGGVDNAGIDGGAAQTDKTQTNEGGSVAQR